MEEKYIARAQSIIKQLHDCVDNEGIIVYRDVPENVRAYLKRAFYDLPEDERQLARVKWVMENTGHLLYVRGFNDADDLLQRAIVRGYIKDNQVILRELDNPSEFDAFGNKLPKSVIYEIIARNKTWYHRVTDLAKQYSVERKNLFEHCKVLDGHGIEILPKVVRKLSSTNISTIVEYLGDFVDENGYVDSVISSKISSTVKKICFKFYENQGIDYLSQTQCLHLFVKQHTPFKFLREVVIPENKDDKVFIDLYKQTKQQLVDFAVDGKISLLKTKNEKLYNRVRTIRERLGYPTIRSTVDTMLEDYGIVYTAQSATGHARVYLSGHEYIGDKIKEYYISGKSAEEILYHDNLIDVSNMSVIHGGLMHKVRFETNKIRRERNDNGYTVSDYLSEYHNAYYPKVTKKTEPLIKTNITVMES